MPDIYQSISENDAKIVDANDKITTLSQAISTYLNGGKGHVKSYKIGDREMVFSLEIFQKEVDRLKTELIQLRANGNRLESLKAAYEGKSVAIGRAFYRG